ncbi:hypothetical protein QTG54_002601 [Skeletonema marinoi]|uniref:Uncharacterized protein n=1 Tax=Skeletonema marinoi TaxID=267567 RepID=A0AAD8YJJ5_9STRA|nr:hypothetical protein QTG54_002601 [Skeletonema marinoi]
MKFIKIATISFLAGNAVDAAAHSYSAECHKAYDDLFLCVKKVITDDTTGAKESAWGKVATEAKACYTAAGDDEAAQKACAMPMFELSAEDCPDGFDTFKKACDIFSYEFEDFVLDLAEELSLKVLPKSLLKKLLKRFLNSSWMLPSGKRRRTNSSPRPRSQRVSVEL